MSQRVHLTVFGCVLFAWMVAWVPNASALDVSGAITGVKTWTLADNPIRVNGDVLVSEGAQLTIEAGVTVKFLAAGSLFVGGTLIARGTAEQPITFTSAATFPAAKDWGQIKFGAQSAPGFFDEENNYESGSILEHVNVEYAGANDQPSIECDGSAPYFSNLLLQKGGAQGIKAEHLVAPVYFGDSQVLGIVPTALLVDTESKIVLERAKFLGLTPEWSHDGLSIVANAVELKDVVVHGLFDDYVYAVYIVSNSVVADRIQIVNDAPSPRGNGLCASGAVVSSSYLSGFATACNLGYGGSALVDSVVERSANVFSSEIARCLILDAYSWGQMIRFSNVVGTVFSGGTRYHFEHCVVDGCSFIGNSYLELDYTTVTNSLFSGWSQVVSNHPLVKVRTYLGSCSFNDNNMMGIDAPYLLAMMYPDFNSFNARNNWWGAAGDEQIGAAIYDNVDDGSVAKVDFSGYLLTPSTLPPLSSPSNVASALLNGEIKVQWDQNPEADIAGYKVYWDTDGPGSPYANVVDVGMDLSHSLTGIEPGKSYFVAVTAYDNQADGVADQFDTHESWYSEAGGNAPQIKRKAIVLAGGTPDANDTQWVATKNIVDDAYGTLRARGYTDADIYYFSADQGGDNVDEQTDSTRLQMAIVDWATNATELLIYINAPGGIGTFRLNEHASLTAQHVDQWIDALQQSAPGMRVIFIYDACRSGSFLPILKATGDQDRIIITSTGADESVHRADVGLLSFSGLFFNRIIAGHSLRTAFEQAGDAVRTAFVAQHPELDVTGDGVGKAADLAAIDDIWLGNAMTLAIAPPVVGSVPGAFQIMRGDWLSATIGDVTGQNPIEEIVAVVLPPSVRNQTNPNLSIFDLPIAKLVKLTDGQWQFSYRDFTEVGEYQVAIFAKDSMGMKSQPKVFSVTANRVPLVAIYGMLFN